MKLVSLLTMLFLTSCVLTPFEGAKRFVYYVNNDGATLPVFVSGADSKEIIFYIHGGPGSSAVLYSYADMWDSIREKYRVVFYDQRGSGGGRGHIDKEDLTVDQHVEDMDAVIDSVLELYPDSEIYLLGHSYGGMISSAYTSVKEEKIAGLMLLSPAMNVVDLTTRIPARMLDTFINPYLTGTLEVDGKPKGRNISSDSRKEWEEAKRFYEDNNPLKLDSFIQHNIYVNIADQIVGLEKFNEYYKAVLPKLIADPLLEPFIWSTQQDIMLPVLHANKESSRNLETDPKFNLANITIPVMLIVGDMDLVVPKKSSIQSYNKIGTPDARKTLHEYPIASHNSFLEYPKRMERDIITFIES